MLNNSDNENSGASSYRRTQGRLNQMNNPHSVDKAKQVDINKRFNNLPNELKKLILDDTYNLFLAENINLYWQLSTIERQKKLVTEEQLAKLKDFQLAAIVSNLGVQAILEGLISLTQFEKMQQYHIKAILTEEGFFALRNDLIAIDGLLEMDEASLNECLSYTYLRDLKLAKTLESEVKEKISYSDVELVDTAGEEELDDFLDSLTPDGQDELFLRASRN